jgi:hypothetical protein
MTDLGELVLDRGVDVIDEVGLKAEAVGQEAAAVGGSQVGGLEEALEEEDLEGVGALVLVVQQQQRAPQAVHALDLRLPVVVIIIIIINIIIII